MESVWSCHVSLRLTITSLCLTIPFSLKGVSSGGVGMLRRFILCVPRRRQHYAVQSLSCRLQADSLNYSVGNYFPYKLK